jgi:hypothetical protein
MSLLRPSPSRQRPRLNLDNLSRRDRLHLRRSHSGLRPGPGDLTEQAQPGLYLANPSAAEVSDE